MTISKNKEELKKVEPEISWKLYTDWIIGLKGRIKATNKIIYNTQKFTQIS